MWGERSTRMTKGRAHRIAETASGAGDGIVPRNLTQGDKWGSRETLEGRPEGELLAREPPSDLRAVVRHEGLFAVDRIFFRYRSNLHTEHVWKLTSEGLVATQVTGAALEMLRDVPDLTLVALTHKLEPVSAEDEPPLIESAAAVASQIEGNVAARVLRVLYRIANDPPYYRQPLIEVEMNELLDDLGYERAKDGYHDPNNRARVRDVLLALARVELRGQIYDPATQIRDLYVAPLIALRGGRYRQ